MMFSNVRKMNVLPIYKYKDSVANKPNMAKMISQHENKMKVWGQIILKFHVAFMFAFQL